MRATRTVLVTALTISRRAVILWPPRSSPSTPRSFSFSPRIQPGFRNIRLPAVFAPLAAALQRRSLHSAAGDRLYRGRRLLAAAEFRPDLPGAQEGADYRDGSQQIRRSQVLRRRGRLSRRRFPRMAGGRDQSLGAARLLCYRSARATQIGQLLLFSSHLLRR